jgi:heme/copper-type cytochrome/quinol oxidase subunit 3
LNDSRPDVRPRSLGGCGLALFLGSLSMLFAAGMVGLLYLRLQASAQGTAPFNQPLPWTLWLSTLLLLGVSFTMHAAAHAAKARAPSRPAGAGAGAWPRLSLRSPDMSGVWLLAATVLVLAFLTSQAPALFTLLERHFAILGQVKEAALASTSATATLPAYVTDPRRYLFGLMFFLVLLHALHVLGGLVALAIVLSRVFSRPSGNASGAGGVSGGDVAASIRLAAVYWHFLDVVWLVMFVGFLVA